MRKVFSVMHITLILAAVAPIAYIICIAIGFLGGPPTNFFIAQNDPFYVGFRSITFFIVVLVSTVLLIFFGLIFKKNGYVEWRIQQELEKKSIIWPQRSFLGFMFFYWIIQLLQIELIAILGVLLSLVYGTETFVMFWASLAFIGFSLIENRRVVWENRIQHMIKKQEQNQTYDQNT
jgi:hypothetical protein